MTFESLPNSENLNYKKIEVPFGTYYLCDTFFISELNEGVHLDWEKCLLIINQLMEHYGPNSKIGYISNRINHFSVNPSNWTKIEKNYNFIYASAIVVYNNSNLMNASIEKQFTNIPMKKCMSIIEAVEWMQNFKALN